MGAEVSELSSNSSGNRGAESLLAHEAARRDSDLQTVIEAWPDLPADARAEVLAIVAKWKK
jgi:hypothetical protein